MGCATSQDEKRQKEVCLLFDQTFFFDINIGILFLQKLFIE
jgi:hypothetical protein